MKITNHMAILRNLRNIVEARVSDEHIDKIKRALISPEWRKGARRVLPFRYVAAARACPSLTGVIDQALLSSLTDMKPLDGKTVVLVDVSGSMDAKLSGKSDLTRMDAAATLAAVLPGDPHVYTFSDRLVDVGHPRGIAGVETIVRSQPHGGTALGGAVQAMNRLPMDRLIVITDEQSRSHVPEPVASRAYMINVASAQHGVGYGERWIHLDGFSEQVLRFVEEFERL